MLTMEFNGVEGTLLQEELLTSGMVGQKLRLKFDSFWEDLQKTVVFVAGGICRTAQIPQEDLAMTEIDVEIPVTALVGGHRLFVGVYGYYEDGSYATPTVMVRGPRVRHGADPNESPDGGGLPVWANLQNQIGQLTELNTQAKKSLVAAINELREQLSESGKTAYEYAREGGYTGSEREFTRKLAQEFPVKLPNPQTLTFEGMAEGVYDGSQSLAVNIPGARNYRVLSKTLPQESTTITYPLSEEAIAKLNAAQSWLLEVYMPLNGSTNNHSALSYLTVSTYTTADTNVLVSSVAAIPTQMLSHITYTAISAMFVKGIHTYAPGMQIVSLYKNNQVAPDVTAKACKWKLLSTDRLRIKGTASIPAGTVFNLYALNIRQMENL